MTTAANLSNLDLNKRILSVVIFTFFAYLSIGLPLAILPQLIHEQLGFSSFAAGAVISVQYVATLLIRPKAGQWADTLGARQVVLMGLVFCIGSGVCSLLALLFMSTPSVSLALFILGRLFLGTGESLTSTGSTLWGMNLVDRKETSRVISWNGVATFSAMALGAPLGVMLVKYFSIYSFAIVTILIGAFGFLLAYKKPTVRVKVDTKIAFLKVASKVWIFGVGLALGTVGFGVISTFITLYFAEKNWENAAFALSIFSIGFVFVRLIFGQAIPKFGGIKVSLVSFAVEALGLFLIWGSDHISIVYVGSFLVGAGFSLVFPSLGVEAVKQVEIENRGSALGVYNSFLDIALMFIGPLAGLIIPLIGTQNLYGVAGIIVVLAMMLMGFLLMKSKPVRS